MFKSIPADDYLMDSFPCALQKDIAVQGRVFLTQNRVVFYSNILSFVTMVVVMFEEIIAIQRRPSTFQNSIVISTHETQVWIVSSLVCI